VEKPEKPRCGAQTRAEDKHPCKRYPLKFSTRCRNHGGATPRARKKAADLAAVSELEEAAKKLGVGTAVDNPLSALSQLAGEVLLWKDILRDHVIGLKDKLRYAGFQGAEQIRGEVLLYERALDRTITVLATIAKLNIDERLAAIAEDQARMVERALVAALEESGATPEQQRRASEALPRHLRLVV
jgi:hypothetical protein